MDGALFADEPLLEVSNHQYSEFAPTPSRRRLRHQRRQVGKSEIELTVPLHYQPPKLGHDALDLLERSTLASPILFPHSAVKSDGPVNDEAGILSVGFCCCQCVRTQEIGVIENFGAFGEFLEPGCYCLAWPINNISGRISLRIQQLDVLCESKTKDNVFVHVQMSIQYRVIAQKAYEAYYKLSNPVHQIRTYVYDVVRATIPRLNVDEVFTSRQEISDVVYARLAEVFKDFGYEVIASLLTSVQPDGLVVASMNEIMAAQKSKDAMPHRAGAYWVKLVKEAEATAEAMYLSGVGIANQRRALCGGLKDIVADWSSGQSSVSHKEVMDILLVTLYIDMLSAVSSNEMVLRHGPDEVHRIRQNIPPLQTRTVPDLLSN